MKKSLFKLISCLLLGGGLALLSAPVSADIFLTQSFPGNQVFNPCGTADLDLNSAAGAQTEILFGTGFTLASITFNAECAVELGTGAWVAANIFVDPAPVTPGPVGDILVSPSNSAKAFCSGNGAVGLNAWVSASTQGAISLPAGIHSVRVQRVGAGATQCWFGDISLIIQN